MFQYVNVIKVFHNTHTIKGVKYLCVVNSVLSNNTILKGIKGL